MLQLPAAREASRGERAPHYERHRPEQTLLLWHGEKPNAGRR